MTERPILPEGIRRLVDPARLAQDALGRSEAQVFDAGGCFLKIAPRGSLRRAATAQDYFARRGFGAPLMAYEQDGTRDYLLVRTLPGKNACLWMDDPAWLASAVGEAMRALHDTDARDCPLADCNERAAEAFEREAGRPFDGDLSRLRKDALTQGDCCLPNIFFDSGRFAGFVDLGDAGLGDRHLDLCWALWSLAYNLKTKAHNDRLLDAYGRDAVDGERLALCARLTLYDL